MEIRLYKNCVFFWDIVIFELSYVNTTSVINCSNLKKFLNKENTHYKVTIKMKILVSCALLIQSITKSMMNKMF